GNPGGLRDLGDGHPALVQLDGAEQRWENDYGLPYAHVRFAEEPRWENDYGPVRFVVGSHLGHPSLPVRIVVGLPPRCDLLPVGRTVVSSLGRDFLSVFLPIGRHLGYPPL